MSNQRPWESFGTREYTDAERAMFAKFDDVMFILPVTHEPLTRFPVWEPDEELCDECGYACTSSKECVEISGLHDEQE